MAQPPITTSVKLDADMKARVQRLAETQRRSPHWVLREAIARYVTQEELRQDFDREARESWEDYQRTGLHVTGAEMDAWFERVIAGEHDAEPPEPHK